MKKLLLVLLAFIAIFTFIRLFDNAQATEGSVKSPLRLTAEGSETPTVISEGFNLEIPVEIFR